ncbi:MAG: hypothetical protein CM1200mP2_44600 [Planctomycetaceae bacterium]|nr:MAG: hypothetical protein CM1200mP2_44600 [Planctomycetaceae bacterium]
MQRQAKISSCPVLRFSRAGTLRPLGTINASPDAARYPCGARPAKAGLLCGCRMYVEPVPSFRQVTVPVCASTAWMKMPMKGQMLAAK